MPGKFERRRRGRQQWVEPAERDWCVRRLQHDQVIVPLGSLTYRQAALVIALLSTVRFIMHADTDVATGLLLSVIYGLLVPSVGERPALQPTSLMNQ